MMKRILFSAWLLVLPTMAAMGQSQPPAPNGAAWPYGFVPTQGEWQAAWASKTDYTGSAPCGTLGCTFTGKVLFEPSSTANAGLNCGAGVAPTVPSDGDLWCTTTGVFARINGVTTTLGGSAMTWTVSQGGTGQVTFTANRPILGNGTSGLIQGTTTTTNGSTLFATASGTPGNGNCASWNNGNVVDAGVGACGGSGGSGTVTSGLINQMTYYAAGGTTVSGLATCNNGYIGTDGSGVPSCRTTLVSGLQSGITAVGTLATGVWNGTVVGSTYGGTGVNNGASTITIGGNVAFSGAFTFAGTLTGNTAVTFPTSGNIPNSTGNSGGVPFYNTSTTLATSAVLTANLPVFGGGAGSAPFVGTRSGNTTEVGTVSGALTSGNGLKSDASGNIVDFGSVPASLSVQDQTLSGGANVTPNAIGTVTTGTTTVDCGKSPLQTMTNNGASTFAAPANDGSCIVYMLNGASAGAITFSGFTVSSNTGDALNTTNTNKFFISIVRAGGVSNYVIRALQ